MPDDGLAKRRFWTLRIVQVLGIAVVLVGIAGLGERFPMPRAAVAALVVTGTALFFGLPIVLSRKWKSEK